MHELVGYQVLRHVWQPMQTQNTRKAKNLPDIALEVRQ